jgi:quercetin dioxygenase-like cupin family protein
MSGPEVVVLADQVAYQDGSVVSRRILSGKQGNVTLFAFAAGEGLTEHSSPYTALVVVIEGEASIRVGGVEHTVRGGESIVLPASIPHALEARQPFKMLLVLIA